MPKALWPYPTFESWFIKLWDPKTECSVVVIMATNYATDDSQLTIIFAPGNLNNSLAAKEEDASSSASSTSLPKLLEPSLKAFRHVPIFSFPTYILPTQT